MPMPNFEAAAAEAAITDDKPAAYDLEFKLAGTELAARVMTDSEFALLAARTNDDLGDAYAETLNLMEAVLKPGQYNLLMRRFRDPKDPLEVDDLTAVMKWMIEEKAANPTSSASDSSAGAQIDGGTSTGTSPRRASTRSRSGSAAS